MSIHAEEIVYDARSQLLRPLALVAGIARDIALSRGLAWRLFVRNISASYRQTLLGYFWLLFQPIAHAAIWVLLSYNRIINVGDMEIPYPLYVLSGIVIWNSFTLALSTPLQLFLESKPVMTRINMPREAILVMALFVVLFDSVIRAVALVPLYPYYGVSLGMEALWAVPAFLMVVIFGFSLGLLCVPIGALFSDVMRVITVSIQFLFFLTPIAYQPIENGLFETIVRYNPVRPLLTTARELMTGRPPTSLDEFFLVSAAALLLLFAGLVIYRLSMTRLIERMSA